MSYTTVKAIYAEWEAGDFYELLERYGTIKVTIVKKEKDEA